MTATRVRMVPVALAAWAGAAAATLAPELAGGVALGGWAVAFTVLAIAARRPTTHRTAVVIMLVAAAGAAAASHVAFSLPARTAAASLALEGGRAVAVTAFVTGKVERRALGDLAFDAIASTIVVGAAQRAVSVEVVVRVQPGEVDRVGDLDVGAVVLARGIAAPSDPGKRAVLIVTASRGVHVVRPPTGVIAVAADLRRGLADATADLPQPGAGLVPGLAVGDTSRVDPSLDAAMTSSSLSHLTAVSGANCALVVGLVFGASALAGLGRALRVAAGLAALGGFVLLVTPEPSVARAATMAAVAMLALLLGRPASGLSLLSLAVTVLLIVDPWLSTSLGFALSAVATAALVVLARPLATGLARHMPGPLALALAVPLSAQLACGPLLVLVSPSVPLYGVAANLLAALAAPLGTILGLAACLAAPVPLLQSGLAALAWVPAAWIAATATTIAAIPGGQAPWLEGWWGVAGLSAIGAAIWLLIVRPGDRRVARAARTVAGGLVALVAGVVAGGAGLSSVAAPLTVPADWAILACDIGQGDAILVRSAGRIALIDTGPDPARLASCLTKAGAAHIDLLVLTHYDADHSGGRDAVLGRIDTVLHGPPVRPSDQAALRELAAGGAELVPATSGLHGRLGDASWRVVWPVGASRGFPGGNDAGIVVVFSGGRVPTAVFLADLSAAPQSALVAAGTLPRGVEVVKVAHHGSADQDEALYRVLDPAIALISAGRGNDYGHPRAETLAILEGLGARTLRTDLSGTIALSDVDGGVAVWSEHPSGVAPDR